MLLIIQRSVKDSIVIIVPVLFGHMLHKTIPEVPIRMIYTEIDAKHSHSFEKQLDFLKQKNVLTYNRNGFKTKSGLLQIFYDIKTSTGKMQVEYRIRQPSDEYYTKEDAAEANFVRENYTFDGTNNVGFVAELAVAACTD